MSNSNTINNNTNQINAQPLIPTNQAQFADRQVQATEGGPGHANINPNLDPRNFPILEREAFFNNRQVQLVGLWHEPDIELLQRLVQQRTNNIAGFEPFFEFFDAEYAAQQRELLQNGSPSA